MNFPAVSIDAELKSLWPETTLGCVFWSAPVRPEAPRLWDYFAAKILPDLRQRLEATPLAEMPQIGEARQAFKAFGRDPGRVRVSSEALYRRLRQGKDLYHVNTAVDANNLISLETGFSLGTYDLSKLNGGIVLRRGLQGEAYGGIGKDEIDLARMPLLADAHGPFGCPCSDSRRAMVGDSEAGATPAALLTVIYGFSGSGPVEAALSLTKERLLAFAEAQRQHAAVVC